MSMIKSWSLPSSLRWRRRQTPDTLTKSSQPRPLQSLHQRNLTRTGWTVWTTREDRTSLSSLTLPVGGNELSITATSSQLVSEVINVGQKDPLLWPNPDLKDFALVLLVLSSSSPSLFHLFSLLLSFIYIYFFVKPFSERTSRQNCFLILHCNPRWSELWCDQLLCNVPLMTGASPVACCALTCVCPAKL